MDKKTNTVLKFGVPKGSLEGATDSLLARAGWKIHKFERNYFPDVNDPELSVSLNRIQEIGGYVVEGILDAGIAALDWLREMDIEDKLVRVSDLVYAKSSLRQSRWVLAVAGDSPYYKVEDLAGKRIATEVQHLTERYFKEKNVPVQIFYSWGATEAKVVEGLADGIVEVTETGTTIRAQGLRIIDEVMGSNPVLVASRQAWADPVKRKKIEQLNLLLQGALRAESYVAIKMNVPVEKLDKVQAILPCLNSPTVSPLQDGGWLSVESVVETSIVRDLIPRLKEAGAEGILEYNLNKVI